MKRESRRCIEANIDETLFGDAMRDALDSDARQRREIRALRKALAWVARNDFSDSVKAMAREALARTVRK